MIRQPPRSPSSPHTPLLRPPRRVPDELWEEIEGLLPPPPSRAKGGRPRADDRLLLDAILYVLWAGCPWRALPAEFGPWQTVYEDRKSTRLNSSHANISYAVF